MATVFLAAGKERPVQQRHPWIFSGAVRRVQGYVGRGDVVDVCDAQGEWLARGTWSSGSQIRVRLFTWEAEEPLGPSFSGRGFLRAIGGRRARGFNTPAGACRLVFAESDGLPGLIVDRYGGFLVVQFLTQGMAVRADAIVALLAELVQPLGIYERGDADVREKEGLPRDDGVRWGQAPPPQLTIVEGARRLLVDLCGGQKTGSYLDQAQNRDRVAAYCRGAEVLDCFCYTGGFTIAAATDAATVEAVDSSASALAMLGDNLAQNQHTAQVAAVEGDVFKMLRQYRHEGRSFDVVILDPPKFAHSHGQIERAARGYKDINLIAMQILRPGGVLASFSCSGLIGPDLFQKILFGAAVDARRDVQILERLTQAADHPLLLTFPEGEYLKGLICRVW